MRLYMGGMRAAFSFLRNISWKCRISAVLPVGLLATVICVLNYKLYMPSGQERKSS